MSHELGAQMIPVVALQDSKASGTHCDEHMLKSSRLYTEMGQVTLTHCRVTGLPHIERLLGEWNHVYVYVVRGWHTIVRTCRE